MTNESGQDDAELAQATAARIAAEKVYQEASAKVIHIRPLGPGEEPVAKLPRT